MRKYIFLLLNISFLITTGSAQNKQANLNNQPALTDYINIYQKYISSVRGSSCQMHPSCSHFGLKAYKSYNPFKATFLTADRLLRCSHDPRHYNKVLTSGGIRLLDFPVSDSVEAKELLLKRQNKLVLFSAIDTSYAGKFINYLISQKYYREALLELNRLIFYNNENIHDSQYLNYLVCKRALNELEGAIFVHKNSFPARVRENLSIVNELGNIHYELGNYNEALKHYDECIESFSDSILRDKSLLMKGLVYAHLKQWKESKNMFSSLSDSSTFGYSKINCLHILQNKENLVYKKPALAGVLSVIPGLGYVYTGHKQTALSSIIVNGLLAYATYSSYKRENYGMVALTGLFSFSFYLGNITGSVKSAKRYNAKQDYNTVARLKANIYY